MKSITTTELQQKLAAGEALNLIDVREVGEVAEGHIPGAVNIPLGLLEFRMHELDKNKPYIMVCRSGGRSGQATAFLEAQGYDVTNMTGGMLEWAGEVK
ncbi:MAG: rhodanese-like domain-containing protein [Solibacillus sp.]